jgi:hypothetical protein
MLLNSGWHFLQGINCPEQLRIFVSARLWRTFLSGLVRALSKALSPGPAHEEMHLKKGDSVRVVVKSTEVMIQKD